MNHAAMIAIVRQINLITSFMNKLNLHLIHQAAYIQQFQLKIHHKFDKQNTVSDALFKLSCQEAEANEEFILNTLFTESIYIFHVLITEISNEFKILLREDYKYNSQ